MKRSSEVLIWIARRSSYVCLVEVTKQTSDVSALITRSRRHRVTHNNRETEERGGVWTVGDSCVVLPPAAIAIGTIDDRNHSER